MSMKAGLSGKMYLSCIILCRDEKPNEYYIGNFPPGSITKNPTNKQKNHSHKKTPPKSKEHRLPLPQKQQPKTMTTNQPKKPPNQFKNHKKPTKPLNANQKKKLQAPKENFASICDTGTPLWGIFMIWSHLTSLTVTGRVAMLSIFFRGEQAHALSLWQILERKCWIFFVGFQSIFSRKVPLFFLLP